MKKSRLSTLQREKRAVLRAMDRDLEIMSWLARSRASELSTLTGEDRVRELMGDVLPRRERRQEVSTLTTDVEPPEPMTAERLRTLSEALEGLGEVADDPMMRTYYPVPRRFL